LVVRHHHRLPDVQALQLVPVIDLDAGSADDILEGQIGAPAELGAQRAEPLFHHRDETVGGLEMVDDDNAGVRAGYTLGLADELEGIADDADDVAYEDVIEGVV